MFSKNRQDINTVKEEKVLLLEMGQYERRGFKPNCVSLWSTNLLVFKYFNLILFAHHFIWSLGHATDDYLFSDCQFFPLGDRFCPRFSKFPSSPTHIQLQYLALAVSCTNNPISRQSLRRQGLAARLSGCI